MHYIQLYFLILIDVFRCAVAQKFPFASIFSRISSEKFSFIFTCIRYVLVDSRQSLIRNLFFSHFHCNSFLIFVCFLQLIHNLDFLQFLAFMCLKELNCLQRISCIFHCFKEFHLPLLCFYGEFLHFHKVSLVLYRCSLFYAEVLCVPAYSCKFISNIARSGLAISCPKLLFLHYLLGRRRSLHFTNDFYFHMSSKEISFMYLHSMHFSRLVTGHSCFSRLKISCFL